MPRDVRTYFGMFSDEGNAVVRDAAMAAIVTLDAGVDRESALSALRGRTASILATHPEVADTAVREHIGAALAGPLASRGLRPIESGDEIVDQARTAAGSRLPIALATRRQAVTRAHLGNAAASRRAPRGVGTGRERVVLAR